MTISEHQSIRKKNPFPSANFFNQLVPQGPPWDRSQPPYVGERATANRYAWRPSARHSCLRLQTTVYYRINHRLSTLSFITTTCITLLNIHTSQQFTHSACLFVSCDSCNEWQVLSLISLNKYLKLENSVFSGRQKPN
jgi:hypothetical protein